MNMRPEHQLLLCCARTNSSRENQDKIRKLVNDGLHWSCLLQMAKGHGVAPLLYYRLLRINADRKIPESIMSALQNLYYGNLARNILLGREIKNILTAFERKEIPALVLRGLLLAETIYKNIALRPVADLYFLVPREHVSQVAKTLLELGFESRWPGPMPRGNSTELWFVKQTPGERRHLRTLIVDIHQDITSSIRFKTTVKIRAEQVIMDARPVRIQGIKTLAMVPEDLILHLTLRHCFERIIRLCDIAEVLKAKRNEVRWEFLLEKAKENRIATNMYYTLCHAQRFLQTPVPREILEKLRPSWLRKTLLDNIFTKTTYPLDSTSFPKGRKYFLQILASDRLLDIPRVLWKVLFPSHEWLVYYYTSPRSRKLYFKHISNLATIFLAGLGDILSILAKS